jgi:hypothetical protein
MIEEVAFSAQIFLTIGDQPERRGGNSFFDDPIEGGDMLATSHSLFQ